MSEAALGVWIVTALTGMYLFAFTTGVGRPESVARTSRLPPLVLFVHPLTTSTGLAIWIVVIVTASQTLAWVAFGVLVLGTLLGDILLVRTLRERGPAHGYVPPELDREHTAAENARFNTTTAESLMPRPAIAAHGALALVTVVLVLISALGWGGQL